ncbi:hypothetical protein Sjap_024615 [Stephania japonica]|uniref:Phytocyanin domain-containing protein n=1 Tax=Stephania japonica TaxID=461633 RepID=A0AAP0HK09_9MAGN
MSIFTCLLWICVTASLSLVSARGETHVVGGDEGWTQVPNYGDWAQGRTFHVGDTLLFNYDENLHSVIQVNETAYEDCIKEPNLATFSSGNGPFRLAEVGRQWYICGVGDHCEHGQRLSINVLP